MQVVDYNDQHREAWQEFVRRHPDGTVFHGIGWKNVVGRSYRLPSAYRLILDGKRVIGVAPFFRARSLSFKSTLLSLPYAPYAGMLLDQGLDEGAAVEALGWKDEELTIRRLTPQARSGQLVTMMIDLPEEAGELWKGLKQEPRKHVRKAERNGVEFLTEGEFLDDFIKCYRVHMKRFGTPIHKRSFFRNILTELPENSEIWAIKKQDKVIGAQIVLFDKGSICLYTGFSLPEYNSIRAGMLLAWGCIREAIDRGFKRLDYGRSKRDSGPYNFKLQWGAKPVALSYYRLQNGSRKYTGVPKPGRLSQVWSRLPRLVTDPLGPLLRRYVP